MVKENVRRKMVAKVRVGPSEEAPELGDACQMRRCQGDSSHLRGARRTTPAGLARHGPIVRATCRFRRVFGQVPHPDACAVSFATALRCVRARVGGLSSTGL